MLLKLGGNYFRIIIIVAFLLLLAVLGLGLVSRTYPVVAIAAVTLTLGIITLQLRGTGPLPSTMGTRRMVLMLIVGGMFLATIIVAASRLSG